MSLKEVNNSNNATIPNAFFTKLHNTLLSPSPTALLVAAAASTALLFLGLFLSGAMTSIGAAGFASTWIKAVGSGLFWSTSTINIFLGIIGIVHAYKFFSTEKKQEQPHTPPPATENAPATEDLPEENPIEESVDVVSSPISTTDATRTEDVSPAIEAPPEIVHQNNTSNTTQKEPTLPPVTTTSVPATTSPSMNIIQIAAPMLTSTTTTIKKPLPPKTTPQVTAPQDPLKAINKEIDQTMNELRLLNDRLSTGLLSTGLRDASRAVVEGYKKTRNLDADAYIKQTVILIKQAYAVGWLEQTLTLAKSIPYRGDLHELNKLTDKLKILMEKKRDCS